MKWRFVICGHIGISVCGFAQQPAKYGYAQIIDSRGLILCSATYSVYMVRRIHYFYSLTKDSPTKYFSIANLKKDFPDNTEFVKAIKKLSYKEYSLQKDGQYLINDLYLKSINKNEMRQLSINQFVL